ncbi:hypothetical protein QTP86_025446 [Hemibagrus guttatus]|nr:hypothetical protein QTP86_025446 [Hemibagrus guttatus]
MHLRLGQQQLKQGQEQKQQRHVLLSSKRKLILSYNKPS